MFDMTLEYSRSRFAFGRSIGSYQAIKHRLADLLCELEASKAVATAAAKAVQSHSSDASVRVSVAKAYISDVSRTFVSECQQIFGGIGMTWEHDLHLYFRRVISNAGMFGTSIEHRERLARLVAG
jgi:alkylation response protein AidB-like acyl-CoA dehydrogenase